MTGLNMIWSSSLVISVILVLRKLWGKKCNPNIRYMLWLLVAIRILIPIEFVFEVEKDTFVATAIETGEETRQQVVNQIVNPVFDEEILNNREEQIVANDSDRKTDSEQSKQNFDNNEKISKRIQLTEILGWIWMIGSVCLALYWLGLNVYSFSRIQKTRLINIKATIPVYEVEQINGLVGVIRPRIFLSVQIAADEERREYVLAHELQHYRVGDHIWQFVRCLCVIAQWFNPLVWVAYFKSQEDCELACDYRVLKKLDEKKHACYAETLLYILKNSKASQKVLITAMGDNKKNMKIRLEGILAKQNRKPFVAVLIALIVLLIAGGTFASYQIKEDTSSYQVKQLEMLDEKNGWAITTENELVYTQEGLRGFSVVKHFDGISKITDGYLHADFVGDNTAYITYFEDSTQELIVEYTSNKGTTWNKTIIPYKEYAKISDAGSAYLSFINESTGYLLYCSTPAAGQMVKLLFTTTDGGENFSFVQDVSNEIEGYPQGISFLNVKYGYIAVSYHGQDAYLYETTDGGNTWNKETPLPKEDNINYIDGFAPVFFGEKQWNGIMLAKEVSDKAYYKVLTTTDGGASWKIEGILETESIRSYAAQADECFYVVDMIGNVTEVSFDELLIMKEEQEEEKEENSYMLLEEYTGYLDEFIHDIYDFQPSDLDGDGLVDRIYKTMIRENICDYRLELGNGATIEFGVDATAWTVPNFEFVDLTGDGKQDIIYHATPPVGSNGGPWSLDLAVFVATEDGYEVSSLPFEEGISGPLIPYLVFDFEFVADDMIRVQVENYENEILIPYGEGTPLEYYYMNNVELRDYVAGLGEKQISEICEYYVDYSTIPARLTCSSNLFGKWTSCGLATTLSYEDGVFVIEEIVFDENIYDSAVEEKLNLAINIEEHYITNTGDPSNLYCIGEDNVLWGCGRNNSGQLGQGTQDYIFREEMVKIADNVVHVDYSQQGFMIYLTTDGKLYGVGNAGSGALLQYDEFTWERYWAMETEVVSSPYLLMEDVAYARCGKSDVACLKEDGSVWIWGTIGCDEGEVAFVAEPKKVLESIVLVTGGQFNHAALGQDGTVWAWGYNYAGNCGVADKNIVSEPEKVAEGVNMVWTGRTQYNTEYIHIADFDGVYERQLENTIIRKQDGTYLRCGVDVGEEKVLPVYYEAVDYTVTCTHEFVPYEENFTEEEVIELLREQLILAYNNAYGEYEPSDVEPTLYSGDKERYAYMIPRLEISNETETYYAIQFIWEFRIEKKTGKITVYYNGIEPFEYEFNPLDESALAFAG